MELFKCKGFLRVVIPLVQSQRYRGKINIQRPRAPHFERAKFLALAKPFFARQDLDPIERCRVELNPTATTSPKSSPYRDIIARECRNWFNQSNMTVICHANSMTQEEQFQIQVTLHKHNMHLKRYGAEVMQTAFHQTKYEPMLPLFESSFYLIFSEKTQVTNILKIIRKSPQLMLMAGIIEGRLLHKDAFTAYAQLPDLQTARAILAQTLTQNAVQITQHLNQHQSILIQHLESHIKQQQEQQSQEENLNDNKS